MSLCTKSGQVACGTLGCRVSSLCCQADIGYGCATGASCFTNAGSIGCWWTSSVMPSGTRPCFPYADAAIGDDCGSASWCQFCSSTEYPFCFTNVILGGQVPLTAVSCDAFTGLTTITASDAGSTFVQAVSSTPTDSSSTRTGASRITPPPVITPAPTPLFTTPSTPTAVPEPSSSLSTGVIAGIAIGAFFAIAVIALLAFFLYRKQRRPPVEGAGQPPPLPGYPGYADHAGQGYGVEQVPYGYAPPVPKPPVVEQRYEVPG